MYLPFDLGKHDGALLVSNQFCSDSVTVAVAILHLRYFNGDLDELDSADWLYQEGFRAAVDPWLLRGGITKDSEGHISSFGFEDCLSVFVEAGYIEWWHENVLLFRYAVETCKR